MEEAINVNFCKKKLEKRRLAKKTFTSCVYFFEKCKKN